MLANYLLCLILSGVCLGQLTELNVTHTDMSQSMKEFVVGESKSLLSTGTNFEQLAKKLVLIMNTKYGNGWFTQFGTNSDVNGLLTAKNSTLQMQYKTDKITIGQLQVQTCNNTANVTNFTDVIKRARNSQINVIEEDNHELAIQLEQDIKAVLSKDDMDTCDRTALMGDISNWCFRILSVKINNQISSHSNISPRRALVSAGLIAQHYSYGPVKAYVFTVGDLYIDIRVE